VDKIEHLLVCLIEECAEVQKAVSKALRFGLDDHAPDNPTITNDIDIANECVDLLAIIEMLRDENIIPSQNTSQMLQAKKDKVAKYMKYAEERGSLING